MSIKRDIGRTLKAMERLSERRDAELLDLLSRREMYTFLYPLDACYPDPPAILPGNVYPKKVNT
jgi:hypothetical protein